MQFFVPDFSSADSIVVGKATLAWTRKNPSVNRMYTGPGGGRDIKSANTNWSNALAFIYPKIPQILQSPDDGIELQGQDDLLHCVEPVRRLGDGRRCFRARRRHSVR